MNLKINWKETSLWLAMLLLTAATYFATTHFKFSSPVKIIVWIVWLLVFAGIGYFTAKGQQVLAFAMEARTELLKVVWPTRQETIQTTSIVMIMVATTGFILWGIDTIMMWVIAKITHLG